MFSQKFSNVTPKGGWDRFTPQANMLSMVLHILQSTLTFRATFPYSVMLLQFSLSLGLTYSASLQILHNYFPIIPFFLFIVYFLKKEISSFSVLRNILV